VCVFVLLFSRIGVGGYAKGGSGPAEIHVYLAVSKKEDTLYDGTFGIFAA